MGLRLKLTLLNVFLVAVAGSLLSWRAMVTQEQTLLNEKMVRADELLTNLITFNQEAVILKDEFQLEISANRFLENQDVVLLHLDMPGAKVVATDLDQVEAVENAIESGRVRVGIQGQEVMFLRRDVEVKGKTFGTYTAGISLASLHEKVVAQRNRLLLLAGLITSVVMLLASLLNNRLIRPMDKLTRFTRELGQGELGRELHLDRRDEFGQLADAISWMSVQLLRAQEELVQNERLAQELEIAQTIQEQFLPATDVALEGVDYAVYFQAAKQVGGDGYDLFRLADGRVGFTVSDVSGKGVEGALGMIVATTLMRYAISSGLTDPLEILDQVNDELVKMLPGTMFATMGFVVIDPATGEGEFVSAGHPEILKLTDAGPEDMTGRETGVPLGMAESELWRTRTYKKAFRLQHGEGIFIYTDGISETFNPEGELFDDEGVDRFLRSNPGLGPQALVEQLVAELDRFRAGRRELDDDMTIVAFRTGGTVANS